MCKAVFIIIISVTIVGTLYSQNTSDVDTFRNLISPNESRPEYSIKIDNKNEFRLLLTGLFAFYKVFISSQDAAKCTFYPSCSVYALNTIKINGLIGILDAIDRLTRCNGSNADRYHIHESSQRLYDPVKKLHR